MTERRPTARPAPKAAARPSAKPPARKRKSTAPRAAPRARRTSPPATPTPPRLVPAPVRPPSRTPPEPPSGTATLAPAASAEAALPKYLRAGVPIAIALFAIVVLGARWSDPAVVIFDEAHYIKWAREINQDRVFAPDIRFEFLGQSYNLTQTPVNAEHPPLGKYLIALSMEHFGTGQLDLTWDQYYLGCERAAKEPGDDKQLDPACAAGRTWEGCEKIARPACEKEARSWRLPSILLGGSAVAAVYLIGLRLFNSVPAGLLAAALLLLDTMWYLQSRMAMLDAIAASLTAWAFALALGRGWTQRLLSGLIMGAAMGSKFTGAFLLPAFLFVHLLRAAPIPGRPHALDVLVRTPYGRGAVTFVLGLAVPLLGFAATYGPYLARWTDTAGAGYAFGHLVFSIFYALSVDYGFDFQHCWSSPPYEWIPHVIPTFYYWPGHPTAAPPYMYAVGNVALWWSATLAALAVPVGLLVRWFRLGRPAPDWARLLRAQLPGTRSGAFLVAALLLVGSYAPWFLLSRTSFNYYATLNVPYFAVVLAGVLAWAWHRGPRSRLAAVAGLGLVAFWFAAWWPIVGGADISGAHFDNVWDLVPWMQRFGMKDRCPTT